MHGRWGDLNLPHSMWIIYKSLSNYMYQYNVSSIRLDSSQAIYVHICLLLNNAPMLIYAPPQKLFIVSHWLQSKNYNCVMEQFLVNEKNVHQGIQIDWKTRIKNTALKYKQGKKNIEGSSLKLYHLTKFWGTSFHLGTTSTYFT